MKSRIKHIEECTKLFRIEMPEDLVKRTVEEVYKEIKKTAKIPGFRPGAAPQDLLEKHYSKDAEREILKRLIPEGYKNALEFHNVTPTGLPDITNIDFGIGKPLTFEAQVDIRPAIKLRNYKGIKVSKKRVSLSKEELDEALSRLRSVYASHNDAERPAKKGDYAVCDVEAFAEGKPISRKEKLWVLVEKDASLLGMGEELIGLTKGQMKEIEIKLPDSYPDKKYAGKSAKFKVSVNAVKEKSLPELDDAFAKMVKLESLDALKKEIESEILARKENALRIDMENQILDRLIKDNKFSAPRALASRQKEVFAKRMEAELLRKGLSADDAEKKIKELDSKLETDAKTRIQVYFILDDIAVKEKIEVSEHDIEESLKAAAISAGQPVEAVRKYYEKENLLGGLAEEIKEAKVLKFLLKEAEIREDKEKEGKIRIQKEK